MALFSRDKKVSPPDDQVMAASPVAGAPGGAGVDSAQNEGAAPQTDSEGSQPEMGKYGPKVSITSFDTAPNELVWQLPLNGELFSVLPGPDRPDYSVLVLERPLHFYPGKTFDLNRLDADQRTEDRRGRSMARVHALLVCARFVGQQLHPGMSDLAINVAYVIDNSLARDQRVDFAKIEFAAVGLISEGHRDPAPNGSEDQPASEAQPEVEGQPEAGAFLQQGADAPSGEQSEPERDGDSELVTAPEAPVHVADEGRSPIESESGTPADSEAGFRSGSPAEPQPEPESPAEPASKAHAEPEMDPAPDAQPLEPGEIGDERPPAMIVMNDVCNEAVAALRAGIAEQRGAKIRNLTVTLALDPANRVTGLSGNADGQPPVPTPQTFERLNAVLARLAELPADHAVARLTLTLEGESFTSDVQYRT